MTQVTRAPRATWWVTVIGDRGTRTISSHGFGRRQSAAVAGFHAAVKFYLWDANVCVLLMQRYADGRSVTHAAKSTDQHSAEFCQSFYRLEG